MNLRLTQEQAEDLADLLGTCLSDLSVEIADTDNPDYRGGLKARRQRLAQVTEELRGLLAAEPAASRVDLGISEELEIEESHPGG